MFLEYCTVFCFVGFRWSSVLFLEKCLPLFNVTMLKILKYLRLNYNQGIW